MSKTSLEEHHLQQRPRQRVKCEGLRIADWRSEILQAMFWLKNEGFGDEVDPTLLERFLGVESHIDPQYLDRLLEEGYVELAGARYKLSEAGTRKAGVEFAASFEDFMTPSLAQCGRSSWCPAFRGLAPSECESDA